MPVYVYQKGQKTKEMVFRIGYAPQAINGWRRIIAGFPAVQYKGSGWTGAARGRGHVTWGEVEKHMKHCKDTAIQEREKKEKRLTADICDMI